MKGGLGETAGRHSAFSVARQLLGRLPRGHSNRTGPDPTNRCADGVYTMMALLRLFLPLFGFVVSQPVLGQSSLTQNEMQALAPTGKLRAALYLGGPANVVIDPKSGEMKGVGYELGKELARRMGVPYEPVIYQTPKLIVEDTASGKWDISFIAQDPDREKILNFTGVYLKI